MKSRKKVNQQKKAWKNKTYANPSKATNLIEAR
jgi:hypothetical protein